MGRTVFGYNRVLFFDFFYCPGALRRPVPNVNGE